ncbi:MAG: helicase [Cressdnaviricota sp.]|nr:MAG: helicase [Cressdnaviricota sp.]
MSKRMRAWCFTSWEKAKPPKFYKGMQYLCFAPEYTPTTNKFHWQGYVYWKSGKTLKACKRALRQGDGCNLEVCKGDAKANKNYIKGPYSKGGKLKPANPDFKEFGDIPEQGKRTDLNLIKDKILDGAKVDDIVVNQPMVYHQYGRTLTKLEDIVLRRKFRTEMTKGVWYWGESGVGKSHKAFEGYNPSTHYVYPYDKGWWDGYTGQEIVIINEFRGQIRFGELLDLCDKWPKTVKRRGREPVPFLAKKLIITSCSPVDEIFHNLSESDKLEQFHRRFESIELTER